MTEKNMDLTRKINAGQKREQMLSPLPDIPLLGAFRTGSLYKKTLQGAPVHGLLSSSTASHNLQIDAVTRAGVMKSDGIIITIDEEAILIVSGQTFKTLIMILTIATEQLPRKNEITTEAIQKGRAVRITLEDYMRLCGIRDKKSAREQLNTSIFAIYGMSLEWDEITYIPDKNGHVKKTPVHHRMRITDHTITTEEGNPVKHGVAEVRLSYDMAEYLAGAYIMPYPSALLTVNTQYNPYSLPLGWKLCTLYNMNYGEPTQGRTTVQTLLRAAKGIPRYESIVATGRVYDRIIKPFQRDMQELVTRGIISKYYYYDDSGAEIKNIADLSYATFSRLHIYYEMDNYPHHIDNYPDQAPPIEMKRISNAITKSGKRKKTKQSPSSHQTTIDEALS